MSIVVRTGTSKYGFWLAGYYEDFQGSRCIADDGNAPSSDGAYSATNTHHGNIMNGEATLNPRYRWSVRDRANNSEFSDSNNYLLLNDGIARWATYDPIRLGNGKDWASRSQLQYPSGIAHPNRTRYDKAGVSTSDDTYLEISSGWDSSIRYNIPLGDTDATYGRDAMYAYSARNWSSAGTTFAGFTSTSTEPDFMQYAYLTGVWAGERIQMFAYNSTTGAATTHENHPERIFTPIKSRAGKPFLVVNTYMNEDSDAKLNNVAPSGNLRPVISSKNTLNSRSDGDFFTIRLATHAMNGNPATTPPNGIESAVDTSVPVEYKINIGFPENTSFKKSTGSDNAQPAISWIFRPDSGHGLSASIPYYHQIFDAGTITPELEPWYDLDFEIDYTNNKFKVYHDGTEVTATNDGGGSYSSGYTMNQNTQTSANFNAEEMTGWELFVDNYNSSSVTANKKATINTMIDRVALYRPLTDVVSNSSPSAVSSWKCTMPANGISQASIRVYDDDTEQNLTKLFINDKISDWKLLMFSGNIDRPLWCGTIDSVGIQQSATDKTRNLTIKARDSLAILDRQISSWEIGQIGLGDDDVVLSRQGEVTNLSEKMFLGAAKLETSGTKLGFESADYQELHDQRMRTHSAHPIQMYNNEDTEGANFVENEWLGYDVIGFNNDAGDGLVAVLNFTNSYWTTVGDKYEIYNSRFDGQQTFAIGSGGTSFSAYDHLKVSGTYSSNSTANLVQISNEDADGVTQSNIYFKFSTRPYRVSNGVNDYLSTGEHIVIAEVNVGSPGVTGVFKALSVVTKNGFFYVKTDRVTTQSTRTNAGFHFDIEKAFIADTDEGSKYRVAHAVWMRDLAKSPYFRKQYGIYGFNFVDAGVTSGAITASTNTIQVSSSFFDSSDKSGVAQIIDSDGFVDTFSYTGYLDPAADGNYYLVGVNGLSKDHASGVNIYSLSTSNDYKHLWLLWSDMRNNGNANGDGGWRKKDFGLLTPFADNYELSMSFTDQFNDAGEYVDFVDLKFGEEVDVWSLDSTIDPSTNAPYSKPLADENTREMSNGYSGNAITSLLGGGIKFKCLSAQATGLATGDEIIIFNSVSYNGLHKITNITGSATKEIEISGTTYTTVEPYSATGHFFKKVASAHREEELAGWENKAGSVLVMDCSKFFNLNTYANNGRYGQNSGGKVSIGEYETEYHGFPILMDNYWKEATSNFLNNASPYREHDNNRLWIQEVCELNRAILLGDTVIETKPSTSQLSNFPDFGFGKIKGTRKNNQQNASSEIFWYSYDGKLESTVTESATSATSGAGLTITCSGGDFVTDGVKVGMRVRNVTAKWVAQISAVTATTIVITGSPYQETGSTRTDVAISDSIEIPEQLYGVFLTGDAGVNYTPQEAEEFLEGILFDETVKSNGSLARIDINASNQQNSSNAFDQVIIGASVSPRYALRFMMKLAGYVTSPNSGTYWMSDKMRFLWSMVLSDTWLTQASINTWFDIGSVPITNNMTLDSDNSDFDSFGSIVDARGGKSILSTIRESVNSTGFGYENGKRLPITYQMGRDNKIEVRPTYNCGEAINRDILQISKLDASMGSHITNVRVYYNNGASFKDYPAPTLNQTYRWKIIESPEITNDEEALSVAKEEYFKAKRKAIKVEGDIIRDSSHSDKMLDKGRYGYIGDTARCLERGATALSVLGVSSLAPSNAYNYVWSAQAGTLFQGIQNALDGNMKSNDTKMYQYDRYGKAYYTQGTNAGDTETYDEWYWWWGANSVNHAVQIVHIPSGCPTTGDTNSEDLRIWIALKDGQTGTDIDNAEFTIGITDPAFDKTPQTPFTNHHGTPSSYAPTLACTSSGYTSVNVSRNGLYEIDIPSTYWSTKPSGAKFIISVNIDYLKDILRHRCGDPTASGILHNAHDITNMGVSSWTATNSDSLFPLGVRKYDNMSGAYGVRNAWYAPRIIIVEDVRWRPATTCTFTDSGLGLSSEPMVIKDINWTVNERNVERVGLTLERDQTKETGGLISYLYPEISKGRGNGGAGGSGGNKDKPLPPPARDGGGQGSQGNGTPYNPPSVGNPIGKTAFSPKAITGARFNPQSGGGFVSTTNTNMMTAGTFGKINKNLALGDDLVSGNTFGILGQSKPLPAVNTQRAVDGLGDTIKQNSSTATATTEGFIMSGVTDDSSDDVTTHTQTVTVKVPDDVADEVVSVDCTYSLGGTASSVAVLDVTMECVETGESITRTLKISGNKEKQSINFIGSSPISGADVKGNTMKLTIERTPSDGDDTATYSSLVVHNLKFNFMRYSVKGIGTANLGFNPY